MSRTASLAALAGAVLALSLGFQQAAQAAPGAPVPPPPGVATLLHRGRSTHLWNVDILAEDGRLVSTARVLNHIVSLDGPAPAAFRDARARS